MKEGRRILEIAFNASECLYGEFIDTCSKNGLNPAEVLRKLIRRYVIVEYIRKRGNEKMHRSDNYELSWEERWNIIEEMTSNMSEDERAEWIESIG